MKYGELRSRVCEANRSLGRSGLVVLTWGNVSGIDQDRSIMAIKPSGVSYMDLQPEDIAVLDIETGRLLDGALRPSSDTPTHLSLYRNFGEVFGIVHTHSTFATAWAQHQTGIPAYGTTHADSFHGTVPVTRPLTEEEVARDYEGETGALIVDHFRSNDIDPAEMPAVLIPFHGPFAWGNSPEGALENVVVLEEVAKIAFYTGAIQPPAETLPEYFLEKHYQRKHGPRAYYGQARTGKKRRRYE